MRSTVSPRALAAASLALALLVPGSAIAWPHGPMNHVLLHGNEGTKERSVAAPDGAGGVTIAWADQRNGNWDIYAQHLDASGARTWAAGGVPVCDDAGEQRDPVITALPEGGVMIGWVDRRGGSADIYAQRLDAAGVAQWIADGLPVIAIPGNDEIAPEIAYQFEGVNFVWQDGTPGAWNVYAQRLDLAGTPLWVGGGLPICVMTGDQTEPRIAVGSNVLVMVATWTDARGGAATDIYAQKVDFDGTVRWAVNGVSVCNATGQQSQPRITMLPVGEAAVVWRDERGGNADLYAQRLGSGSGSGAWGANGVAIVTGTNDAASPQVASDGAGGIFTSSLDLETFGATGMRMQHVGPWGAVLWSAEGIIQATLASAERPARLVEDGIGGVIVIWQDLREAGNGQLWARHLNAAGYDLWNGERLVAQSQWPNIINLAAVTDGRGGAILAFSPILVWDTFAKRVDRWGMTGAEPRLTSVRDVANDQGGFVRVSWDASPLDTDPLHESIEEYWLLREVPVSVATEMRDRGAPVLSGGDPAPAPGVRSLVEVEGAAASWEYVASAPAAHLASYSKIVTTTTDSTASGNPRTHFLVQARALYGAGWWESNPDSGYSVDDLAPVTPAPFAGTWVPGTGTFLTWGANLESDLAGYRVHRGAGTGFVPGPGNLIASTATTHFEDPAGGPVYKLSAVDVHGNESPFATLVPAGIVDAPGADLPSEVALGGVTPNPAHGAIAVRYALPRDGRVRLTVIDAQGRTVRVIESGERAAGHWSAGWDGRDAAGGTCASGLYWLRLEAGDRVRTARFVRLN